MLFILDIHPVVQHASHIVSQVCLTFLKKQKILYFNGQNYHWNTIAAITSKSLKNASSYNTASYFTHLCWKLALHFLNYRHLSISVCVVHAGISFRAFCSNRNFMMVWRSTSENFTFCWHSSEMKKKSKDLANFQFTLEKNISGYSDKTYFW